MNAVIDLTGSAIPAGGFFVAAEPTFGLGTADFTTGLNFENSDNVTHLLVRGFTGSNGDDLDFDGNSQVLDHILVSPGLVDVFVGVDILHFNASFPSELAEDPTTALGSADHNPVESRYRFR